MYQVLDSKAKLSCALKEVAEGSHEKKKGGVVVLKFIPRAIKSNQASRNRQNGGPVLGVLSGTAGIFTDPYSVLDLGLDRNTNFDEVISTRPHERFILTSVKGKVALKKK